MKCSATCAGWPLEPLILALLGDALVRYEESLKRAERREWKEGGAAG